MKAQFGDWCVECGQKIHVGDEIAPVGSLGYGWAHATCPPEIPHGPVCPGCHIEKALDGSCDCPDQDRKPVVSGLYGPDLDLVKALVDSGQPPYDPATCWYCGGPATMRLAFPLDNAYFVNVCECIDGPTPAQIDAALRSVQS